MRTATFELETSVEEMQAWREAQVRAHPQPVKPLTLDQRTRLLSVVAEAAAENGDATVRAFCEILIARLKAFT